MLPSKYTSHSTLAVALSINHMTPALVQGQYTYSLAASVLTDALWQLRECLNT